MQNPTVEPSAQPEHAAADQCKVFAEQVSLVYQLGTTGAITVIAIGWLYVMLVWQTAPQSELLLWASVVTLLVGRYAVKWRAHCVGVHQKTPRYQR